MIKKTLPRLIDMREHNTHTVAMAAVLYAEARWKDFEVWAIEHGIHVNDEFKRTLRAWRVSWELHERIQRDQVSIAEVLKLANDLGPPLEFQRLIDAALAGGGRAVSEPDAAGMETR